LLRAVKKIFSPPPEADFGSPADNSLPRVVDADNAFFYISTPPCFFTFFADITLREMQTIKHSFKNNCPYGALNTDRISPYSLHTTPDDDYQ
jgi:hypothetical protein